MQAKTHLYLTLDSQQERKILTKKSEEMYRVKEHFEWYKKQISFKIIQQEIKIIIIIINKNPPWLSEKEKRKILKEKEPKEIATERNLLFRSTRLLLI